MLKENPLSVKCQKQKNVILSDNFIINKKNFLRILFDDIWDMINLIKIIENTWGIGFNLIKNSLWY